MYYRSDLDDIYYNQYLGYTRYNLFCSTGGYDLVLRSSDLARYPGIYTGFIYWQALSLYVMPILDNILQSIVQFIEFILHYEDDSGQ